MAGSNRGAITAFIGVICFGAGAFIAALNYPPEQRYERYRYAPGDVELASTSLAGKSKPAEYREPCNGPQGRDESDLCAQWRAARAAEAGALWAARGFWVGLLSTIGLGITIILTLRAVNAATVATKIADKQLAHARHEARAWLAITAELQKVAVFEKTVRFYYLIRLTNIGATVAKNVQLQQTVIDGGPGITDVINKWIALWKKVRGGGGGTLMPGETLTTNLWAFQDRDRFKPNERGTVIYPALLAYVRYRTTSDQEAHFSRRVFRFGELRKQGGALSMYADPIFLAITLTNGVFLSDQLTIETSSTIAT
jgi:hypothetical protein